MTEDTKMENFSHNKEGYQPKVLVFACNWCSYAGADMAGVSRLQMPPNCRVVRVMCSARVSPEMVLSALFKGMDAVLVLGCHPGDCHYSEGNFYTRRRALVLEKMLDLLGIAKERFQVRWVSAAEGEKFAKTIREVVEQVTSLGPNPIDNSLESLDRKWQKSENSKSEARNSKQIQMTKIKNSKQETK
jgi:coenzyme F420-reducing hydrogenase delta subunit